jgi:pyruvate formate lyase activating enzyme
MISQPTVTGTVLSIDRCSMHDGPGIRTTVFLKGCPLTCLWCHNPESQAFKPELFFLHDRCRQCGACAAACEHGVHSIVDGEHRIDRSRCVQCGRCVEACPNGALEIKGRTMTVEAVMAEVERDRAYFQASGGGMTLSGGEPTSQIRFCRALLEAAHTRGIHTCLETSAYTPGDRLVDLARHVDLFLIDWKETDPERHEQYTGVEQPRIRENLLALDAVGAKVLLRCPIVPGLNDRPDHLAGIARMAEQLRHVVGVEVMPYHPMGASKARSIGRTYPLPDVDFADAAAADRWREAIAAETAKPVT